MAKKAAVKADLGTPSKVPVTERALIKRINRALAKKDQKLIACRDPGDGWLVVSWIDDVRALDNGRIEYEVAGYAGLERQAREVGVLKPYEQLTVPGVWPAKGRRS